MVNYSTKGCLTSNESGKILPICLLQFSHSITDTGIQGPSVTCKGTDSSITLKWGAFRYVGHDGANGINGDVGAQTLYWCEQMDIVF